MYNIFRSGGLLTIKRRVRPRSQVLSCFLILSFTRKLTDFASAMRGVVVEEYGGPEKLLVKDVPKPVISNDDQVLIRVHASAINRADCLQREGKYSVPKGESHVLGLEASGFVEEVGKNVSRFAVGDKVMALLGGGGYAEYVSVHQAQVMKMPHGMSFISAAAIPEVFLTGYQLMHSVGNVQQNESVLIHAGASGVGTAVIQLAQLVNATTFVTAGSDEKLATVKKLGATHIINYKQQDFSDIVVKETDGKGVNLILDPVGASYWEKNIKSLAVDGRWVLYGLLGGGKIDGPILGRLLGKRGHLMATTLRTRSLDYKGQLVSDFARDILPHFASGEVKAIIDSSYSLDDISSAHQHMEEARNIGKIVIKVREDESRDEL